MQFNCSVTISPSQLSPCWRCNWTCSWVQFLSNKLKLILVSCDVKLQEHPSFCSCSVFWYVLFYETLIVLHHGDNDFLFYFDICIKFILSLIISTMKKWQHLTWCVPFYNKNMLERKKKSIIAKLKAFSKYKFKNYLSSVNLSLKSWFSEAVVHRCFPK